MKFNFWTRNSSKFKFDFSIPKTKKQKKRFWRKFFVFCGYSFLVIIFSIAVMFAVFAKDLPTPSKIANRKPTVSTKIYDKTGEVLLYETGDQKRTIVQSDQISQYLKDATVATEDTNFYKHHGFDLKGILAAVYEKVTGKRNVARGGSTITQQYVKNALLTSDRSMVRKIKELIISIELEFMYSKDEILTMYLNEIPYGNANAGAEAASKMYFGKPAKDLTIAEAATLAAIPKAPTYYSPYGTHVDKLINRRNYVIERMRDIGKITDEELKLAKESNTTTLGTSLKARRDSILAPHFSMYVLEKIADEYGEEKIQKSGLKVITTLDFEQQKMAEEAVTSGVPKNTKYGASNAALVAVDPKTGQITSMVGSKDYFDVSTDGNVNVADSLRQPGSSFKPIVYATAFKKQEFSPSRIIFDLETDFGGGYTPHNYNRKTNGPITIRQALANSLNIPAVKVTSLVGIDNVIRTAEDLGITSLNNKVNYGPALGLGTGEIRPVEMAGAFSAFANNGVRHELASILKITDERGVTLYDFEKDKAKEKQALDAQIAYQISSILSDNNARALVFGTRSSLYFPNRTVAAKTGTTSDFKDAWAVGFTPSISVAVWVGNNDSTPMKNGADGSVLAGPIFHNFVEKALSGKPNEEFVKPAGIQELEVERYSNKLPGQYSTELTKDIFAQWQIPTEKDNIHQILKVCRGTNLLAKDDLSVDFTEEKVFTNIHSERPDNPNWENPVRSWAEARGMTSIIPTDYCDSNSIISKVKIANPQANSVINGKVLISATVDGQPLDNIEFFIDGVSIGIASTSPYSIEYDFSNVENGQHEIGLIAKSTNGANLSDKITVVVSDSAGPNISDINVDISQTQPLQANISWITDELSSSIVTYYYDNGSPITKEDISQSLAHSVILNNLLPGKKYNFTITSTDNSSNKSTKSGTFNTNLNTEPIFDDPTSNPYRLN